MNYRLRQCVWELTLACCFQCRYCGSAGGRAREDELTTGECFSVCDQLKELGCSRVNLIGGEIFLRRDWDRIAGRLTGLGIRVTVITNGYLFTEEHTRRLKECGVESVAVSLDGPREIHDQYRQEGSFDRALRAIRVLAEAGIPVSVISTLNKENAARLDDFYRLLRELPLFAWQLQACSPMGNAANGGIDIAFDFAEVLDFVGKNAPTAPFALGVADNIGYFTAREGYLRGDLSGRGFYPGCQAGLTALGIDSVGNVRGCEALYDPLFFEGNLRERSLREIWEDPNAFSYNRRFTEELLSGDCRTCPFGSYCRGGCRSYNYFVHGKLYEAPRCGRKTERFPED